jgi:hypothetical protein
LREKCLAGYRMRYGVVFFGLDRQLVRVTLHGKIHLRDRGSRLSFDVVVEVSRKGASGPYLYWLWECKDYTRPIQVNEIEEFYSKIEQVGRDRTKGPLIYT